MANYLAKPQKLLIRVPPGFRDLCRQEVTEILKSPLQPYKFEPQLEETDQVLLLTQWDFRQAMDLALRATTPFDIELQLASTRIDGRAAWDKLLEKAGFTKIVKPQTPIHLMVEVSHPVVGTEKEVRERLSGFLEAHQYTLSETPTAQRIRVISQKNSTQVYLSLGGYPLYRRSLAIQTSSTAVAPLTENLSASCFLVATQNFTPLLQKDLYAGDIAICAPFAGTGTPGFEALFGINSIPPGLLRQSFGFCEWHDFPQATYDHQKSKLISKISPSFPKLIFGDINEKILTDLKATCEQYQQKIGRGFTTNILCNDFLTTPLAMFEGIDRAFLPINPPFGERLAKKTGGVTIYRNLGQALRTVREKHSICGYVLCPNEETWSALCKELSSLKTSTVHFSQGGQERRLLIFETR